MTGSFIDTVTRQEFLELLEEVRGIKSIMTEVKEQVKNNVRTEFTLRELSQIKGYHPIHIMRMVKRDGVPYKKVGGDIIISRENSALIKSKKVA